MWTLYVMEISAFRETAEFEKAIDYVDKARAARLANMRQESSKVQSLAAGLLLSFVLEKYIAGKVAEGINRVTSKEVLADLSKKKSLKIHEHPIEKAEFGKPLFADCPDIYFNLSHSGDYVLCAMAGKEIGADIQQWRPIHSGIEKRLLNEKEKQYYDSLSGAKRDERFFALWTAKEAFVKCVGEGLSKDFRALYVDFRGRAVTDEETGCVCELFCSDIFADYTIAVCSVCK